MADSPDEQAAATRTAVSATVATPAVIACSSYGSRGSQTEGAVSLMQRALPVWEYGTMPFKRSRTYEEQEPEKEDEVAPEVPTTFATKGVVDLNEEKK